MYIKQTLECLALLNFIFLHYRGAGPGCNTREISDRLVILKDELEALEEKERILDEHKSWIQQSLKIVSEDFDNEKLAFVTYEDLCQCFRDDTLLAIQAPAGTELEVPIPEKVKYSRKNKKTTES